MVVAAAVVSVRRPVVAVRNPPVFTPIRRRILRNVQEGRYLYAGISGSQLGGAVRSLQMWRGVWKLMTWDDERERWQLTAAGVAMLKPKCNCIGPSHRSDCPQWGLPL